MFRTNVGYFTMAPGSLVVQRSGAGGFVGSAKDYLGFLEGCFQVRFVIIFGIPPPFFFGGGGDPYLRLWNLLGSLGLFKGCFQVGLVRNWGHLTYGIPLFSGGRRGDPLRFLCEVLGSFRILSGVCRSSQVWIGWDPLRFFCEALGPVKSGFIGIV